MRGDGAPPYLTVSRSNFQLDRSCSDALYIKNVRRPGGRTTPVTLCGTLGSDRRYPLALYRGTYRTVFKVNSWDAGRGFKLRVCFP